MADVTDDIKEETTKIVIHTAGKDPADVVGLAQELLTYRTTFLDGALKATGTKQISHARRSLDLITPETQKFYDSTFPTGFRGMNLQEDGVLAVAFNQECHMKGCTLQDDTIPLMMHELSHRIGYLPDAKGVPMQESDEFKEAYRRDLADVSGYMQNYNQQQVKKIDDTLQQNCGKTSADLFDIQKAGNKCGAISPHDLREMDDEMFTQNMIVRGLKHRGPVDSHYLPTSRRPEAISRKEVFAETMGHFITDAYYETPPDYKSAEINPTYPDGNDIRSLFPRCAAYVEKEFARLQTIFGPHEAYPEGREPKTKIEITNAPLMALPER